MDTFTNPEPTTHEPVPARDGREAPSRIRVLATSVAVAGLTATGGLAVILATAAATSAPAAATAPAATAAPVTTQPQTDGHAQPPQGGGLGPGHAASGGS